MKLDKEHTNWLQIRLLGSGLALIFLCMVSKWAFADMVVKWPEFYGILLALAWLCYIAIRVADVTKDQREKQGLTPHWTDSKIDDLESRVKALEDKQNSDN